MEPTSMLTGPALASSLLALVTTAHLGLAAIRNHRSVGTGVFSPLAGISFVLTTLPWLFPSAAGVLLGFAVHIGWFIACEKLAPPPSTRPASAPQAGPRPAAAAATPATPSATPRATAPPREAPVAARPKAPKGFVQAPVLAVFDETPAIKTIRIGRPDGFDFVPGQFIAVRVRVDGKEYVRCYSISSAPHVQGYLEVSIKRQGVVSNALHASVRPGTMLSVKAPVGAFRYPSGDDRPIVLLAGGIGVTPLISMLRHAVATEPARPVTLVYSAHTQNDFAFRDELVTMVRRHPQVKVQLSVASGSSHPSIYPGRIDESLLTAAAPDLAHSIVFICGPTAMIEAMKALVARLGVPAAQIRHEFFQQAVAVSTGEVREDAPAPVEVGAAVAAVQHRSRAGQTAPPRGHKMVCARSGKSLAIPPGQTILEAAEDAGLGVDSICRSGVCGTCRVQVIEGDVSCDSSTLDADDRAQGFVLACVSTPQSDCAVNL